MTEPTTAAASLAATLSGVTLALFGVDHYSLLYGLVGALLAMGQIDTVGRRSAVVFVVLSMLVGAAVGSAVMLALPDGWQHRPVLILGSIAGGYGANLIVAALIKALVARIDGLGGPKP